VTAAPIALRPLAAVAAWWFSPAPARRLGAVRLLVGGFATIYLALRLPHLIGYADFPAHDFVPVGPVSLLDRPPPAALVRLLPCVALAAGVGFTLGWRFRLTGPLFAALLLWVTSYRSSWGMIFHTENLLVLHVLVLGVAPAADGLALDARRRGPVADDGRYGWPLRLLAALACATYLLAGLAKLKFAGTAWVSGQVLRDTVAADNLRKILLGSFGSPLAPAFLTHTWLFGALSVVTLVVELGAPLALVGRRLAAAWALAAIGFHLGVLALMAIGFPYPMSGVAFAAMFRAERPIDRTLGWLRSCRARRATARSAAP
jgi:hypothetical protein